jgi:hypothetical protein
MFRRDESLVPIADDHKKPLALVSTERCSCRGAPLLLRNRLYTSNSQPVKPVYANTPEFELVSCPINKWSKLAVVHLRWRRLRCEPGDPNRL